MKEFSFASVYEPRTHFMEFHNRDHRWSSIVCHRRAGKTVSAIGDLTLKALRTPKKNARYAYIAPFYKQAKDVAWQYLKEMTKGIASETRESDLRVILPNGAWITLYGADNPDALRGIYLDGVVLDEFGDCRPSLWAEVILPTLADRRGWALFIGTPKGKNHFYNVHERAKKDEKWFTITLKASESNVLSEEDLLEMKAQMDEAQYMQEFECDFTAAVKGTFYADIIQKMETTGHIKNQPLYDPDQPVQIAADLGYSDSTAFWFWQERPDGVALIDYYENQGQPLNHYIDVLNDRGYDIEKLWLPHDARAKTLQTGRSTVEQLVDAGFPCAITPNIKVQQGIDAVRLILPDCRFDLSRTSDGVEALRAYKREFNELTKTFRDTPLHDWASDGSDAFRYFALVCKRARNRPHPNEAKSINLPTEHTLDKLYADNSSAPILRIARNRI